MAEFLNSFGSGGRIALVISIAFAAHVGVILLRSVVKHVLSWDAVQRWTKLRTLMGLVASIGVFALYFIAIGLALKEFGVSLTAYLASASVLGLAIGFGSQGLVQDVVTGLTVIFSNLLQVGDLVELSGQTGEVQSVGMRFTVLLNPLGAQVFVPNRTLSNVIVYPRGYVRCFADITLTNKDQPDAQALMLASIQNIASSFSIQYPGVARGKIEIDSPTTSVAERTYVRVKFRIWPGRTAPIENAFKEEVLHAMKKLDKDYANWMISINNEVSEKPRVIAPFRQRFPLKSK